MSSENGAIKTLEHRRTMLVDGVNSIAEQQKHLDNLRDSVEIATKQIAEDKAALIDIDNALNILRAGESK